MRKVPKSREKIAPKKAPAKSSAARVKRRPMAEASDVQMLNFTDRSVPLVFQQNQRARRIIMRLDYGSSRIVVVLPKRTTRDEGKRFVLSNKEWIAERLDQLPETVPFEHGAVIPFLGLDHRIRHRPTARGVVWCEDQEIHVAGNEIHLPRRVSDWLKLEARREIDCIAVVAIAAFCEHLRDAARIVRGPAIARFAVADEIPAPMRAVTAALHGPPKRAERTAVGGRPESGKVKSRFSFKRKRTAQRVQAIDRIGTRDQRDARDRRHRDQVEIHHVAERLVDARTVQRDVLDKVEAWLEASNYPVRALDIHPFGESEVEIEALLLPTAVKAGELDALTDHLETLPGVNQVFWSSRSDD